MNLSLPIRVAITIWSPYTTPCSNSPPTLMATKGMTLDAPFRVAITLWSPFTTPCSNTPPTLVATKDCPRPGHANQVLGYLLEQAKIPYEVVAQPKPLVWGGPTQSGDDYCSGWTGVLGELENGTLDTVTSLWTVSPQRSQCFAFSNPVFFQHSVIVMKNTEDVGGNLVALFRVYTGGVWALAFVITLLTSIFLGITVHVFAEEEEEKERSLLSHTSECFWTCMQFVSDQLSSLPRTGAMATHTARWLLSFLGLFALFLLKLYENGLLTEILARNTMTPFRSTAELAVAVGSGRTEYVVTKGTYFEGYLRDDKITAMAPMKAALKKNPMILAPDNQWAMEYLRSRPAGTVGFHAGKAATDLLVGCGEVSVPDYDLPSIRSAFVFNKKHTKLISLLNANINWAYAHVQYVQRRYARPEESCWQAQSYVTLRNLMGMVMLGGVFTLMALVAFGVELFLGAKGRKSVQDLDRDIDREKAFVQRQQPLAGDFCPECSHCSGLRHRRNLVSAPIRHSVHSSTVPEVL